MKIRAVAFNNRKKLFDLRVGASKLAFPYSKAEPPPSPGDFVVRVSVDEELGREGFTYELASGRQGPFTSSRCSSTTRIRPNSGTSFSTG